MTRESLSSWACGVPGAVTRTGSTREGGSWEGELRRPALAWPESMKRTAAAAERQGRVLAFVAHVPLAACGPHDPAPERVALIDPPRGRRRPAWNEHGKIRGRRAQVAAPFPATVIVVDDCSGDDTAAEARAAGAEVVLRHDVTAASAPRSGPDSSRRSARDRVRAILRATTARADELPRISWRCSREADLVQGSAGSPAARPGHSADRRWLTQLYRCSSGSPPAGRSPTARTACGVPARVLNDPRIHLAQEWLDRYELEPYLLTGVPLRLPFRKPPVTVRYHGRGTTKMRLFADGCAPAPAVHLRLGWKR